MEPPNNAPSFWVFILAIIVGIAWALGDRIVEAFWPRKAVT
jgi:hypothetical protein